MIADVNINIKKIKIPSHKNKFGDDYNLTGYICFILFANKMIKNETIFGGFDT